MLPCYNVTEKWMQNSEIESRQRLDSARSRTECTASGEIHGLCAIFTYNDRNIPSHPNNKYKPYICRDRWNPPYHLSGDILR